MNLILLITSLIANAILVFFLIKKPKTIKNDSLEVKEFLHYLTSNDRRALLEIKLIDPSSIYLRSPRSML